MKDYFFFLNKIEHVKRAAFLNHFNFPFSIFYFSINRASKITRLFHSICLFSSKCVTKAPNKTDVQHFSENRFAKEIILIQTIRSSSGVKRKEKKRKEKKNNHLVNTTPNTSRTRLTSYKSWRDFNTRSRDPEHSQFMQIATTANPSMLCLANERRIRSWISVHSAWMPPRTDDVTGVQ